MGMLIGKTPFVKYNKTTGEIRCQGSVCEKLNVSSGEFTVFVVDNGCYVLNTETFKVADVYLPIIELVHGTSLRLNRLKNSVLFEHIDANGAVISSAEIGVKTLLVYKIEPNDSNYEVTESNYFYELYGVNLVYTLQKPKISEDLIDEILSERDSRSYSTQRVISEKLLEQLAANTVSSDTDDDFLESLNDDLSSDDDDIDDISDIIDSPDSDEVDDFGEDEEDEDEENDFFGDEEFEDDEEDEFYEDDFGMDEIEDTPDLDDMLKHGQISVPDYCAKQIEYWGLEYGGIPNNKLLTSLEDMLVVLYKRFPAVQDTIILIWQLINVSDDTYKVCTGYQCTDEDLLPNVIQLAVLLVSSECGYYKPTPLTNKYIADRLKGLGAAFCKSVSPQRLKNWQSSHTVSYQDGEQQVSTSFSAIKALSWGIKKLDWAKIMQQKFNSIPAFCLYLSQLVVFRFSETPNIYTAYSAYSLGSLGWELITGLAYECMSPTFNTPFSYDTVASWFNPNHLLRKVRKRNFKYNLEYTSTFDANKQEYISCATKSFTESVALNALIYPLCRHTTLHSFMSDTYNVVAAPNTFYGDGNFGQSNNWRSSMRYNVLRRFTVFDLDNLDKLKAALGVWDAGEDIKVLSPNLIIDGLDYGVPKTLLKPFVKDWSVMCPEYDIYTRHYFDHSAFRDIVYYFYSRGMLFLLDIAGHDDSFVEMPDNEAFFVREIIYDIAHRVASFFTYTNKLFDVSDKEGNTGTGIFRKKIFSLAFAGTAVEDNAQRLANSTKFGVNVLLDTLEWLKKLYGNYADTYGNFLGIVTFYSRLLNCLCATEPSMEACITTFKSIQAQMFKQGTSYVQYVQHTILYYTTLMNIRVSVGESVDYETCMQKTKVAVTKLKAIFDENNMFNRLVDACNVTMSMCKNNNTMAIGVAPQLENTFRVDFFLNREDGVSCNTVWNDPALDYSVVLFMLHRFSVKTTNGSSAVFLHTLVHDMSLAPASKNMYKMVQAKLWYVFSQSSLFEALNLTTSSDFSEMSNLNPTSLYDLLYNADFSEIERFIAVSRRALYFSSKSNVILAQRGVGQEESTSRFNNYLAGMMPMLAVGWFAVKWETLASLPLSLYEDIVSILEKNVMFISSGEKAVRYLCRAKNSPVHTDMHNKFREYSSNVVLDKRQSMLFVEQLAQKEAKYIGEQEFQRSWVFFDYIIRVPEHETFFRTCWKKFLGGEDYQRVDSTLLPNIRNSLKGQGVWLSELDLITDVTGYKTSLSPEEFFDYGLELCAVSLSRLLLSVDLTESCVSGLRNVQRFVEDRCGHSITTIRQFAEEVERLDMPRILDSGIYTDGMLLLAFLYLLDTVPTRAVVGDNSYTTVLQNSLKINKEAWQGKIQYPPKDKDAFGLI